MKPYLLVFLIALIFADCSKHPANNTQIKRIDFSSEGTTINIDSSLNYNYFKCGHHENLKGTYQGKISPALWQSLNMKLDSIDFDTLKSVDCLNEFDPRVEILMQKGGKNIYFTSNLTCLPTKIRLIFYWIINTHKYVKLAQIKDTIKFHVTVLCPPVERLKPIRFPSKSKKSSSQ